MDLFFREWRCYKKYVEFIEIQKQNKKKYLACVAL